MISISPWIAPVLTFTIVLVMAGVLRRNEEKKRRQKRATTQAAQRDTVRVSDSLAPMNSSGDYSEQSLPRQGKAVGSVR